jgi:hypothetical protein
MTTERRRLLADVPCRGRMYVCGVHGECPRTQTSRGYEAVDAELAGIRDVIIAIHAGTVIGGTVDMSQP